METYDPIYDATRNSLNENTYDPIYDATERAVRIFLNENKQELIEAIAAKIAEKVAKR